MKIVIQCAGRKNCNAGRFGTKERQLVVFVAHPELAPATANQLYARPDDVSDFGGTWRDQLLEYNAKKNGNPLGLLPAYRLYDNAAYGSLVDRFGLDNVYILSAGWGLIRSDFLTPAYDITFNQQANAYQRRRKSDKYNDFKMLPRGITDDVWFIGGKDYLPLFCTLTEEVKGKRIAFFNSINTPRYEKCVFRRFNTPRRTNWHYDCANALVEGRISLTL